jgi:hypothetical protein
MNKKSATEFLPCPSRPFEPTDGKDTHHLSREITAIEKSTTLHNMHNT